MIKFKMLLESLSSSYPFIQLPMQGDDDWPVFQFREGSNLYRVTIVTKYSNEVEVMFSANDHMIPTGRAVNALKVYSTVGKIIEQFLSTHPLVKRVKFSAISDQTVPVYHKLAARIAKQYHGWVSFNPFVEEWIVTLNAS